MARLCPRRCWPARVRPKRCPPGSRARRSICGRGAYAARASAGGVWRRIGWIVALGVAAHLVIALADTFMLGRIAASREAETRALVAQMAPGVALGEDVAAGVAAMLPGGGGGAPQSFLPLANRVFAALAPLGTIGLSAMEFQGETLTLDFAPAAPDLAGRLRAAFAAAGVKANVAESPDGSIRVTARRPMSLALPPALGAARARFGGWWSERSPRERVMLGGLGALLAVLFLVFAVIRPIQGRPRARLRRYPHL